MIITPHLGIGDLLLVKMIEVSHGLHIQHININKPLIQKYSSDYDTKLGFILQLVSLLFPNAVYSINTTPLDFRDFCKKYKANSIYLYDMIHKQPSKNTVCVDDCIVFHTKLRHDYLIDKFNRYILPDLTTFLRSFTTTKKIVIVGERTIGKNYETIKHKTKSLYNELLLLRTKNTVIDLTKEQLTEGGVFDEFLQDIEIINKCICNVTFGIGGPLSLTIAFSKHNISCIPFLKESVYASTIKNIHNNICETVKDLQDILNNNYK